jgi:GNAT superfamily N-acetyltransferase
MPDDLQNQRRATVAGKTNTLTERELDTVVGGIERLDEEATRMGFEIHIETDFNEFARLRRAGGGVVNQTVDPQFSQLDRDAFWLRATDVDGALAGLYGVKVFRTANFMDLLRSERLWFDRGPHAVSPALNIIDPFEPFGGVVSHGAGLWVHPDFRGRGLSGFIPEYVRAIAVKLYAVDSHTGFVFAQHQEHALRAYGFSRVDKVIDGFCPITGSNTELYMGRLTRSEIIRRLRDVAATARVTTEDPQVRAAAVG